MQRRSVESTPARSRPPLLWLALVLGAGLLAEVTQDSAAGTGASAPVLVTRQSERGFYSLSRPPGVRTWMLPIPGDGHNDCDPGDVQGLHFSPDGRSLVAEVVGRGRTSLCLFSLRRVKWSDAESTPTVQVLRVSLTGGGQTSKWAASSEVSGESQPSFQPPPEGLSESALLALVSRDPVTGTRISGMRMAAGLPRTRGQGLQARPDALPLDGWADLEKARSLVLMPRFFPRAGSPYSGALALVTDAGLTGCGKSRIALRAFPEQADGLLRPITDPCEGATGARLKALKEAADRYPAWHPTVTAGLLAFIRTLPGEGGKLCIQRMGVPEGPLQPARCDLAPKARATFDRTWPTFTSDGRALVTWAHFYMPGTEKEIREQVELLPLNDRGEPQEEQATLLLDQVQPNVLQGPGLLKDREGRWRVYAIEKSSGAAQTVLEATLLGVAGGNPETRTMRTELKNLKAVTASQQGGVLLLALAAQGYGEKVPLADRDRDKVFIQVGVE